MIILQLIIDFSLYLMVSITLESIFFQKCELYFQVSRFCYFVSLCYRVILRTGSILFLVIRNEILIFELRFYLIIFSLCFFL